VKRHTCRLLSRRWLGAETFELTLSRPKGFDFAPGQRIDIRKDDIVRAYSLVSAPAERELTLCIRRVAKGRLSPWLAEVEPDTPIHFSGPFGYFLFHLSPRSAIFVATGTGIAPFVSMVRAGVRNVTLLHGATSAEQTYYGPWLAERVAHYTACLSGPVSKSLPYPTFSGRVTDFIGRRLSGQSYDFYVCGRPAMVRDVVRMVDARFPEARVRMEIFGL
jgi:ferredoxin-NADP reductase